MQTFELIAGLRYAVDNTNVIGASAFSFDVDGSGNVTSLNPAAALGGASTLTFNTTPVTIVPGAYTGDYLVPSIGGTNTRFSGMQTFELIAGLRYAVDNTSVIGGSAFSFDVDGSGNVTSLNSAAALGGASTLTFNTTTILVDAQNTISGSWQILGVIVSNATGPTAVKVLPGLVYRFTFGGLEVPFSVFEPCAVNPTHFVLAGFTFDVTCGGADVEVEIDLKPGSNPSTVNLGSVGVTPLAVFGKAGFDATQIDTSSLEINGQAANVAVRGKGKALINFSDLNYDGFIDAVLHFETEGLALMNNAPLMLTGALLDSTPFTGDQPVSDPVHIVP
jgi:hypothetical protein